MKEKTYLAIDLKSFYASVECRERGLDPLQTNLVVADPSRTEKTICLAVSPSLKSYGIPGRPRLFEVMRRVEDINARRKREAPGHTLTGSSWDNNRLLASPSLALDYLVAPPQMSRYLTYSADIYSIYLQYVAPEDIHVYSIDEVFMDVTGYLALYRCSAHALARRILTQVLQETGITATAGIGTNLYLAKVAMDIQAKHSPPDQDGVRIAALDELSYRRLLWTHQPLTDFWRVGPGTARKLNRYGMYTMGDVARCSLEREALLYRLFGVNAELLIDHAWGWEPCTIAHIKAYRPKSNSLGAGQVLHSPYPKEKAGIIVREMAEALTLKLADRGLVTDCLTLTLGYDRGNLGRDYRGAVDTDRYGRAVPKPAHGTTRLERPTSSTREIVEAVMALFGRLADEKLLVRRVNLTAERVVPAGAVPEVLEEEQLNLFTDYEAKRRREEQRQAALERERRLQSAVLTIQKRFGKNAILKGTSLQEGATMRERNGQIGGHRA